MSDPTHNQAALPAADTTAVETQRLLAEIRQFRSQAEEHSKAAEFARKNADSEGLFAVNAKKVCEEHATAISQLKGSVESEANAIKSNKHKSDEFLAALTAGKATIDADAKMIGDKRKESEGAVSAIISSLDTSKTLAQEIEKAKLAADAASKAIDESQEATSHTQTSAETLYSTIEALSSDANEKVKLIEGIQAESNSHFVEIKRTLEAAQTSETELGTVLEHLQKSDEISISHEARIAKLTVELEELLVRVDHLLPGATSASLASSFSKQKVRFAAPQKRWLITFISCIAGLVVVALPSFLAALGFTIPGHAATSTSPEILRSFLLRMPIVIPLVWLAIYAGRNYMLSLRLEEEYAYKEAISTAFEGYKRELTNIPPGDATNPPPLIKLCANILAAIAERPGKIYEGKHHDITIASEAQMAALEASELANKTIASR